MRIPVHLDRRVAGPPAAVFAALQRAGIWRTEDVPQTAHAAGIRAIEVTSSGNQRFKWKVYLARSRGRYAPPPPLLVGRVFADDAGTRIIAQCRRSRVLFLVPLIVTLFLFGSALSAVSLEGWAGVSNLLLVAAIWIIPTAYYFSANGEYEVDARWLLQRFDETLHSFTSKPLDS